MRYMGWSYGDYLDAPQGHVDELKAMLAEQIQRAEIEELKRSL
jgi:hypothetical protein